MLRKNLPNRLPASHPVIWPRSCLKPPSASHVWLRLTMHISKLHTALVWTDALSCLYLSTNKEQNWINASSKQAHTLDTICGSEKKEEKKMHSTINKVTCRASLINHPSVHFMLNLSGTWRATQRRKTTTKWSHFQKYFKSSGFWRSQRQELLWLIQLVCLH